jgi:hypothetical protein
MNCSFKSFRDAYLFRFRKFTVYVFGSMGKKDVVRIYF